MLTDVNRMDKLSFKEKNLCQNVSKIARSLESLLLTLFIGVTLIAPNPTHPNIVSSVRKIKRQISYAAFLIRRKLNFQTYSI